MLGRYFFGHVVFKSHKIMNTEFISSWERITGTRHSMGEFNNSVIKLLQKLFLLYLTWETKF